jgi:hypothetical protein
MAILKLQGETMICLKSKTKINKKYLQYKILTFLITTYSASILAAWLSNPFNVAQWLWDTSGELVVDQDVSFRLSMWDGVTIGTLLFNELNFELKSPGKKLIIHQVKIKFILFYVFCNSD